MYAVANGHAPNCMSVPIVISIHLYKQLHALGDFERGPEYSFYVGFP